MASAGTYHARKNGMGQDIAAFGLPVATLGYNIAVWENTGSVRLALHRLDSQSDFFLVLPDSAYIHPSRSLRIPNVVIRRYQCRAERSQRSDGVNALGVISNSTILKM